MDYGKRPPLDEQKSLFEATVAAEGVTTSAGEGTGLSLVAAGLAGAGANSFVSMLAVIHPGDPTQVDSRDVTAFNDGTGGVTVASAFKGGQVAAGVPYKIVTFRFVPAEVAAIDAKLGAFTSAQNLKAILGNLTTTKNLGGILGALDTTDNLKGILGAYTAASNLKAAIDAVALEATLGTHDTDIKGLLTTIAGYLDTEIAAILAAVDTEVATIDGIVDNILLDTQIRTIQSGVKVINAGITKYLHIDSGTNGAEILSIVVEGVIAHDWTLDVYVPAADAEAATQAKSKRDTIPYLAADTEGGLLSPFGIPFDCYLDFTNDGANDQIDQVTITYRSRGVLTLTWET